MAFFLCRSCDELTMVMISDERLLKNYTCRLCGGKLRKRQRWTNELRNPNLPPPIFLTVVDETDWTPTNMHQPLGGWHEHQKIITAEEDVSDDELRSRDVYLCRGEHRESTMLLDLKKVGPRKYRAVKTDDRTSPY